MLHTQLLWSGLKVKVEAGMALLASHVNLVGNHTPGG